ncbi:MAG: hypothetical protein WAV20_11115 [Blastocatellia bacterium]
MASYVPAGALAFVEIDSLSDVVDGLTGTTAWRELAPVLGLSSQLRQVGLVGDLIGRTGLGPDEAVVAGRAQFAVAITGVESDTGETEQGPYLHLRPDFALIVETHSKPETAARLVRERASLIAERIFGLPILKDSEDYSGSEVLAFQGPEPHRQLVASAVGSVILIANRKDAIKLCLDAIQGRTASLAEDQALKQMGPEINRGASVFAYVTAAGIQRLTTLWPVFLAGRPSTPETSNQFSDLLEHLSKQSLLGLLYAADFESGGVREKYLTVLRPLVAEALSESLKPASASSVESLPLVPRTIESITLVKVERAGEMPERVLKQLAPAVDLVAGVALREFVISLRQQYALEPTESLGDSVGNEIALVNFGNDQPSAMLIRVNDRSRLIPVVKKYLAQKGAPVSIEEDFGADVLVSSDDERNSAAFVAEFLVLGTRDQIHSIIETSSKHDGIDNQERLGERLAHPYNGSIVSYRRNDDSGKLMLAISKIMRVTDGSNELLERDAARKALDRLPPSISFTEFRNYGIYAESHSAVGNFGAIGALIGGKED